MRRSVHLKISLKQFGKNLIAFLSVLIAFGTSSAQYGPELVFENPVLVSGTANKQGAVYRFNNVAPGVDGVIKLKRFSRPDIVMLDIDLASLGWSKAFQPQFGLSGLVSPNQNWYIDFELSFFKAGTNVLRTMDTVDLTALDVDGDGVSISEYVTYDKPSSIAYSTVSYLTNSATGTLGQTFTCDSCGVSSVLISCTHCGGTGITNNNPCPDCDGSGIVYEACGHPYEGVTGNTVWGPVTNFTNIDTGAIQVMATYQYRNTSLIKFRYGAKSGDVAVDGSGVRLNSTWFRNFKLTPIAPLPIKLLSFTAEYTKPNVSLAWSTSQEHNFSHFVIEQSTDGANFSQTAILFGAGESNSKIDYSYTDKDRKRRGEIIYYRLKQVDIDGRFDYSAVRIIKLGEESNSIRVTTFPNPVVNDLKITLPSSWQNKHVYVDLYNANGQVIKTLQIANSSQTESLSFSSLTRGVYFLNARCGNETARQQVIKN